MEKNILDIIQENMAGLSKGRKRVAAYILSNYDKAAFMTAYKMSRQTDVSESTVVRFAAALGYDGYPGMQKALRELVGSEQASENAGEATE